MNRKRATLVLIIGLLAGLAATVGASRSLSRMAANANTPPPPKVKPVITIKRDIMRGEMVRQEDLKIVSWPEEIAPPSSFQRIEDVSNRVPLVQLLKGEPVLAEKLSKTGTLPGLAAFVEQGMRAVTVKVNEVVGVGGFVTPGNRVDVLTTIDVDPGKVGSTVTKVILQNIQVLAVDERIDATTPKKTDQVKPGQNQQTQPNQVSVATLLVSPQQAERLALAATKGKILLALRGTFEQRAVSTPGITAHELVYGGVALASVSRAQPKPKTSHKKAKPSRSTRVVEVKRTPEVVRIEVIRGVKRDYETFKTN